MFRLEDGRAMRGPATIDQPVWQTRVADGRVQVRAEG
jgi:nitrite reductase/ring-hydroxylating ferredoxin subunit